MAGHEAVLKQEAVEALVTNVDGFFVDCTYGRGGHSQMILDRLSDKGRLMVIDKDLTAIEHAKARFEGDARVTIIHGSFNDIANYIDDNDAGRVSGVLIDLGVSSPQLDVAERGFSFMKDGPLDMRMDQSSGQTVAEWLAIADERDISIVLRKFGEEKFSRRIARSIVETRDEVPLETTHQLANLIDQAIPRKELHKHPATRSFQALRIYINNELKDLEDCLDSIVPILVTDGRLVVISFHSLEDRIVKRFMRNKARGEQLPARLPIRDDQIKRYLRLVGKRIKPSTEEVDRNRRSRSSIMRVAEKIGQ